MKNQDESFQVETVVTPDGNSVSLCKERGGIITSIQYAGTEILYLDTCTLYNEKSNVRGGIPILFPNAGPLHGTEYPFLRQHGFARDSSAWIVEKTLTGFSETLTSSTETLALFPYAFRFTTQAYFEDDGSFTIAQEVTNTGAIEALPLSMGLHPYFAVPNDQKKAMRFNFGGGTIEAQYETWANGESISLDNPNTPLEITIPSVGTLTINVSPEYQKIWVWSLAGKDFVCIEPVMRDNGGLESDPELIQPEMTMATRMNISFKKSHTEQHTTTEE